MFTSVFSMHHVTYMNASYFVFMNILLELMLAKKLLHLLELGAAVCNKRNILQHRLTFVNNAKFLSDYNTVLAHSFYLIDVAV